jgi:hypothetical protein
MTLLGIQSGQIFPVIFVLFPVKANSFPCYPPPPNGLEALIALGLFLVQRPKKGLESGFSRYFSLLLAISGQKLVRSTLGSQPSQIIGTGCIFGQKRRRTKFR